MDQDIDTFINLTAQIKRLLYSHAQVSLEEKTTTMMQMQVLSHLRQQQQIKMSDLAKFLNTSLSSTTQIIERMVQSGFVHRSNDENDRRIVIITITEKGLDKLSQLNQAKKERLKKLFSSIDDRDMKELIRIQEKILRALQ